MRLLGGGGNGGGWGGGPKARIPTTPPTMVGGGVGGGGGMGGTGISPSVTNITTVSTPLSFLFVKTPDTYHPSSPTTPKEESGGKGTRGGGGGQKWGGSLTHDVLSTKMDIAHGSVREGGGGGAG